MSGRSALGNAVAPLLLLAAAGCSGGGGGSNPGTTSFQLDALSLPDGAVWPINREIVFRFREPVDFATVSSNTIQIRSAADAPAIGVFRLRDPFTVVFQPNCPTLADLSDAGLSPGGVEYVLRLPGQDTSANTLRSVEGIPLGLQQVRRFSTPASHQAALVFQDARSGPPVPLLRAEGSASTSTTHIEIGGDPDERVYFERDENRKVVLSEPGFEAPLNLYSDASTRIAVSISFDQPVSPSAENLSSDRLRLEYQDQLDPATWHALDTRVTLAANCTETGATVRLEPVGVLPTSSAVRAVILPGFRDLVGDFVPETDDDFAVVPTRAVEYASLSPADVLSDEVNESFELGGESALSFEDPDALVDTPAAEWGDGRLSAAFAFEGTGGPGGDFDWVVHSSELVLFDTTRTQIIGGRDGAPTTSLTVEGGILDVRNFRIDRGGEVRVQGPNPLQIRATGDVVIRGRLDVSGFPAKDVASFGTGGLTEVGGAGSAGGGGGGTGNWNTSGPTPRGGRGAGPLGHGNLGGHGGEMGIAALENKNLRRPGGGGGGRFAGDWIGTTTWSGLSMAAGPGSDGHP